MALIRRITRTLVRSGAPVAQQYDDAEQLWLDLEPGGEDALVQLQDASIRYRIAVGPIAGRKTLRLHTPGVALEGPGREQPKPFTTARDGVSLNAAVACKARERRKLERLCRYVARPAVALAPEPRRRRPDLEKWMLSSPHSPPRRGGGGEGAGC